jgi:hypothetical protein
MLAHIPLEQRNAMAQGGAAAAMPTIALPPGAAATNAAAAAHTKAEEMIVAGAAEPGFGGGQNAAGGAVMASDHDHAPPGVLRAFREDATGDGAVGRDLPPSPARRRRSVVDERTLALVREEANEPADDSHVSSAMGGAEGAAAAAAAAAAAHSRLEQLNTQTAAVMARVEAKLKGTEFAEELGVPPPGVTRIVGFHMVGSRVSSDAVSSANTSGGATTATTPGAPGTPSPFTPAAASAAAAAGGAALPAAPLTVAAQVARLIAEATSHSNLAQSYIGWCPFW